MSQQQVKEDRTKDKAKVRCGIIYQENIPDIKHVIGKLNDITSMYRNLSILISPLHKPDKEDRKPHYHVLFDSSSELVIETYDKILEQFKGTKSLRVRSAKIYRRYLLHLDNPEKEQFAGGACDLYYINCNRSEIENELQSKDEIQIVSYVFEYLSIEGCRHNVRDFLEYSKSAHEVNVYRDILKYVAGHAYFIAQILK